MLMRLPGAPPCGKMMLTDKAPAVRIAVPCIRITHDGQTPSNARQEVFLGGFFALVGQASSLNQL